jgi:hypothetical protein
MSGDHNMFASGSGDGQRSGWRKRTILDMAKEVKMPYDFVTGEPINLEKLEALEKLVRKDEREACAKVCDKFNFGQAPMMIQRAIRARGQA